WKYESIPDAARCSPITAEFVSITWPSNSSVPTATTSQCMAAHLTGPSHGEGAPCGGDPTMAATRPVRSPNLGVMELRIFTEPQQGATYTDLSTVARYAEALGFGAFFRSDHYTRMG